MVSPTGVGKSYAGIEIVERYLIGFSLGTQALVIVTQAQSEETKTPFHFVEKT